MNVLRTPTLASTNYCTEWNTICPFTRKQHFGSVRYCHTLTYEFPPDRIGKALIDPSYTMEIHRIAEFRFKSLSQTNPANHTPQPPHPRISLHRPLFFTSFTQFYKALLTTPFPSHLELFSYITYETPGRPIDELARENCFTKLVQTSPTQQALHGSWSQYGVDETNASSLRLFH